MMNILKEKRNSIDYLSAVVIGLIAVWAIFYEDGLVAIIRNNSVF